VRDIVQDRAGFLWAGTENGLFRFAGLRFRREPVDDFITDVHQSPDGSLWAGGINHVYRIRGGVITRVPMPAGATLTYRRALAVDGQPVEDADGFRVEEGGCADDDPGTGIAPHEQGLIFEAFRQVDGSPAVSMAARV
jgi:hypothetical protein